MTGSNSASSNLWIARWLAFCGLIAVLGGCTSTPPLTSNGQYKFPTVKRAFENDLAGRTLIFTNEGHGTQVEFFASNGRAYLWYRGNTDAVPSKWMAVSPETDEIPGPPIPLSRGDVAICFQYPSRSYNPVTNQQGGGWECRANRFFAESLVAIIDGDPFNLQTGRVPAVMPRGSTLTIEQILALTPANEKLRYRYKR